MPFINTNPEIFDLMQQYYPDNTGVTGINSVNVPNNNNTPDNNNNVPDNTQKE